MLAAIGTRAQIRAAWSEVRDEAKRLAADRAVLWDRLLDESIQQAALYPALPVPGSASPADEVLDGRDVAALAKLRDDPAAGLSPAGLPRRVLAALRLLEIEAGARQQARWTLGLLAFAVFLSGVGLWLIQRVVQREQRLNALKGDFVASVSHELRAPVASIRLMADASF